MGGRRLAILLLLLGFAALGLVLFGSVKESHLFRLAAPTQAHKPVQEGVQGQVKAAISGTTVNSLTTVNTVNLLENPRYTGRDAQNRSWEVTASRADQQGSTTSGSIVLSQVKANLEVPASGQQTTQTLTMESRQGSYNQSSNKLQLNGNVVLTGRGLTLTAPSVSADINSRTAIATGGVHIQGNIGTTANKPGGWNLNITAPTGHVDQSETRVNLTGGVRGRLTPQ